MSEPETINVPLVIPTGSIVKCTKIHRNVPLTITKIGFPSKLIKFKLGDLDVTLGMDWLTMFKAKIDFKKQKIDLNSSLGKVLSYHRFARPIIEGIISTMKLVLLINKGFLCNVRDLESEAKARPEGISVVSEFLDVSP